MKAAFYNLFFSTISWDSIVFSWVEGRGEVGDRSRKIEKISSGGEGKYL